MYSVLLGITLALGASAQSSSKSAASASRSGSSGSVSASGASSNSVGTPSNSAALPSLSGVSSCVTNCLAMAASADGCESVAAVDCFCPKLRRRSALRRSPRRTILRGGRDADERRLRGVHAQLCQLVGEREREYEWERKRNGPAELERAGGYFECRAGDGDGDGWGARYRAAAGSARGGCGRRVDRRVGGAVVRRRVDSRASHEQTPRSFNPFWSPRTILPQRVVFPYASASLHRGADICLSVYLSVFVSSARKSQYKMGCTTSLTQQILNPATLDTRETTCNENEFATKSAKVRCASHYMDLRELSRFEEGLGFPQTPNTVGGTSNFAVYPPTSSVPSKFLIPKPNRVLSDLYIASNLPSSCRNALSISLTAGVGGGVEPPVGFLHPIFCHAPRTKVRCRASHYMDLRELSRFEQGLGFPQTPNTVGGDWWRGVGVGSNHPILQAIIPLVHCPLKKKEDFSMTYSMAPGESEPLLFTKRSCEIQLVAERVEKRELHLTFFKINSLEDSSDPGSSLILNQEKTSEHLTSETGGGGWGRITGWLPPPNIVASMEEGGVYQSNRGGWGRATGSLKLLTPPGPLFTRRNRKIQALPVKLLVAAETAIAIPGKAGRNPWR
ncbi:hypothetical protein C8R47DRAFT_1064187 [Mycena vitilis]|nr:hypothetical protein C8R47DRAFT_1064187 [Mycena vitilis]